mmetsp:Transcript_5101/g.8551  ORF Transcript_5101/g.8551 Transcript_5101/m.8551 type:complete len:200 (-) Transcript_5101:322-921(-)
MLPSSVPAKICHSSSTLRRQRQIDLTCPIATCTAFEQARCAKLTKRTWPSQVDTTDSSGERSTKSETGFRIPKSKMKRHSALLSGTASLQMRMLASMDAVARSGSGPHVSDNVSSFPGCKRSRVLRHRMRVTAAVCPTISRSKAPFADHADTFPLTCPPYRTLGGGTSQDEQPRLQHAAELGAVSLVKLVIAPALVTCS